MKKNLFENNKFFSIEPWQGVQIVIHFFYFL